MTDRNQFLIEVYRESGGQISNNNSILASYLGFYAIALAALLGLLAGADESLNRGIWIFPSALSFWGLALSWSLQRYVHAALSRKQAIEEEFVTADDRGRFRVGRGPRGRRAWLIDHRQDLLIGGVFFVAGVVFLRFTFVGDPLGFADACLNFAKACT